MPHLKSHIKCICIWTKNYNFIILFLFEKTSLAPTTFFSSPDTLVQTSFLVPGLRTVLQTFTILALRTSTLKSLFVSTTVSRVQGPRSQKGKVPGSLADRTSSANTHPHPRRPNDFGSWSMGSRTFLHQRGLLGQPSVCCTTLNGGQVVC